MALLYNVCTYNGGKFQSTTWDVCCPVFEAIPETLAEVWDALNVAIDTWTPVSAAAAVWDEVTTPVDTWTTPAVPSDVWAEQEFIDQSNC